MVQGRQKQKTAQGGDLILIQSSILKTFDAASDSSELLAKFKSLVARTLIVLYARGLKKRYDGPMVRVFRALMALITRNSHYSLQ